MKASAGVPSVRIDFGRAARLYLQCRDLRPLRPPGMVAIVLALHVYNPARGDWQPHSFEGNSIKVGRYVGDEDAIFLDDVSVAPIHVRIFVEGERVFWQDTRQSRGPYSPLPDPALPRFELQRGSQIQVGAFTLHLSDFRESERPLVVPESAIRATESGAAPAGPTIRATKYKISAAIPGAPVLEELGKTLRLFGYYWPQLLACGPMIILPLIAATPCVALLPKAAQLIWAISLFAILFCGPALLLVNQLAQAQALSSRSITIARNWDAAFKRLGGAWKRCAGSMFAIPICTAIVWSVLAMPLAYLGPLALVLGFAMAFYVLPIALFSTELPGVVWFKSINFACRTYKHVGIVLALVAVPVALLIFGDKPISKLASQLVEPLDVVLSVAAYTILGVLIVSTIQLASLHSNRLYLGICQAENPNDSVLNMRETMAWAYHDPESEEEEEEYEEDIFDLVGEIFFSNDDGDEEDSTNP